MNRWLAAGLLAAGALLPLSYDDPAAAQAAADPAAPQQLALAFHAHSTFSTGNLTIDELAERAAAAGLDGVVLTENYALDIDYGLWPLRGLLRHRASTPSVSSDELPAYLDAVREAQQRHPGMVLIAGLEVIPHFYWSGALWRDDLTLHNTQKNLLVVGLDQPEQWSIVDERRPPPSIVRRLADGWPLLLAAPAFYLWRRTRVVEARVGLFRLSQSRRYRWQAAVVGSIGALFLVNNLVLASRPFDAYAPDPQERAAQALIDRAQTAGGLTFWSMPEASDFHRVTAGEASRLLARLLPSTPWSITVKTDPYPDALSATAGYTGFGGIYQDDVQAAAPGGLWDRLLLDYLNGQRSQPAWGVGELAFHQEGRGGKRLGDVQTVVLTTERTAPAVLASLQSGAFYARRRTAEWGLRLDDFSLQMADGAPGGLLIRLAVSATDGRAERVRIRLVRSGQLWQERQEVTPFDLEWTAPADGRAYYRVEVGKGDQHLLSNPVFIDSRGDSRIAPTFDGTRS